MDTSAGYLERAFHFNTTTAFVLSKAAAPHMLEAGSGAIVNISSAIGRLRDRGFVAYGTAKAALTHMTRLMAADLEDTDDAPKVGKSQHSDTSVVDERERYIVENRLMADNEDELSLAEIGRKLGVSRERARQLEARAKKKLRDRLQPLAA